MPFSKRSANHFRTRRTITSNSPSISLDGLARSIEKKLWLSDPITQRWQCLFLRPRIRRRSDVCAFARVPGLEAASLFPATPPLGKQKRPSELVLAIPAMVGPFRSGGGLHEPVGRFHKPAALTPPRVETGLGNLSVYFVRLHQSSTSCFALSLA